MNKNLKNNIMFGMLCAAGIAGVAIAWNTEREVVSRLQGAPAAAEQAASDAEAAPGGTVDSLIRRIFGWGEGTDEAPGLTSRADAPGGDAPVSSGEDDAVYQPVMPEGEALYPAEDSEPEFLAMSGSNGAVSSFRYLNEEEQRELEGIIASVTTPDMNRVEKIRKIHDWMVVNIQYDLTFTQHDASSVLRDRIAVCSGYSALFANFMDAMGIPNEEIHGTATSSLGTGGHAWNAVQLEDGFYYFVDCCWDDPLMMRGSSGYSSDFRDGYNLRYNYFLVSADAIGADHTATNMPSGVARTSCDWQSYIGVRDTDPSGGRTPTPDPVIDDNGRDDNEPTPVPEPVPPVPETEPHPDPEPVESETESASEDNSRPPKDPSEGTQVDVGPNDDPGPGDQTFYEEAPAEGQSGDVENTEAETPAAATADEVRGLVNGPWAGPVD